MKVNASTALQLEPTTCNEPRRTVAWRRHAWKHLAPMHRCDEHVLPRGARPHRLAKNLRTWMRGSHRIPRHAHCNWVWPQQRTPLPKPRARTHDEPPPRETCKHMASETNCRSLTAPLDHVNAHEHVDQLCQLVGPHECSAAPVDERQGCSLRSAQASIDCAAEVGDRWVRVHAARVRQHSPSKAVALGSIALCEPAQRSAAQHSL